MYPLLDQPYYVHAVGSAVIDQIWTEAPYPIKAAWVQATNSFVCGSADAKRVYDSFKKLDFVAVVDLFMTPTATAFADIVLPAATYAERDGVATTGGNVSYIGITNQAIDLLKNGVSTSWKSHPKYRAANYTTSHSLRITATCAGSASPKGSCQLALNTVRQG